MSQEENDVLFQCSFRRKSPAKVALGIVKAGLLFAAGIAPTLMTGCTLGTNEMSNHTSSSVEKPIEEKVDRLDKEKDEEKAQSIITNSPKEFREAYEKLQEYVNEGIVDKSFSDNLNAICTQLKEIEKELNSDNAKAIKSIINSIDNTIEQIDLSKVSDTDKNVIEEISALTKRIRDKANRLIAQTGSGGSIEEQVDSYIEAKEELEESESSDVTTNSTSSTSTKYTVAEEPEIVVNPTVKAGDYTAGGYLPTTANAKYKNNGLKYPNDFNGILFREGEEEDLYNWVSAGYTKWRTVDTRIASRKGGIDNPRIASFLSVDNSNFGYKAKDDTYCMVTVMTEKYNGNNNNIPDDVRTLLEKFIPNGIIENKSYAKDYNEIMNYIETHDLDKELNLFAGSGDGKNTGTLNTRVCYNCRNYCGDVIYIEPHGEGYTPTNIDPTGDTSGVRASPGIDYILTCDDDPTAFKLVKDDELKKMYSAIRKGTTMFTGSAYNWFGEGADTSIDGSGCLYHQAYVGVKPGIYRCTITIPSTGDKIPVVIENLPINYKKLEWGCTNQEEMDFCVQFMQNWENGVFGQYYHTMLARGSANYFNIQSNYAQYEDNLKAVTGFNELNMHTYEGESIQLNNSEAAAEWAAHLPHAAAFGALELQEGGLRSANYTYCEIAKYGTIHARCTTYDALEAIMYGADDCESYTASMQCLYNVLGYTTRVITGGNHMFFEVKVPADITKSGKEQWMMVDNGVMSEKKWGYMVKSYVYDEVKGLDNSWWSKCFNPRIKSGEAMDFVDTE